MLGNCSVFAGTDVTDGVFFRRRGGSQELFEGIEQGRDFSVKMLDFAGQIAVGGEYLANLHEGADDGDVHLNGPLAAENAGQRKGDIYDVARVRQALRSQFATLKPRTPVP